MLSIARRTQECIAGELGINVPPNRLERTPTGPPTPNFRPTPIQLTPSVERGAGLSIARQRSIRLPVVRPSALPTPLIPLTGPDLEADPEELIDNFLNETLRGQAESFVRKTSGSAVRVPRDDSSPTSAGTATPVPPQVSDNVAADNFRRHQRSHTISDPERSSIPHSESGPFVRGRDDASYRTQSSGLSPPRNGSHSLFPKAISRFPTPPFIKKIGSRLRLLPSEFFPYFSKKEREEVEKKVYSRTHGCERHENCTDCTNVAFAFFENLIMSTAISADERQKIISNNKSLRTIKNELDNLFANGMLSDEAYETITSALPQESSLNNAQRRNAAPESPSPNTNPLAAAISSMSINNDPAPPSYNSSTGPPSLPSRTPQPPERQEIARATSLYAYEGAPEDCSFGVNEQIVIYEHMNAEWCLGKNLRTGKQGLFPTNYVQIAPPPAQIPQPSAYGAYNEKQNGYGGGYPAQYQQQGPPPPGQSNPYNSSVPPMAVAEQPVDGGKPGKGAEMGKKFGKKLGNAAIFGAGATIGGNIVNSIF
ncbi:hypothetical protein BDZ45DRAFT_737149 [Acephala macrosclerotiorum]|nr:hypothetical protein BDZ45DRAFT_737149 [Acephala macrosclerotiorum]